MESKEGTRKNQPVVFSMENDLCVWSRAGVLKPSKCVNAFDCLGCIIDKGVLASYENKRRDLDLKDTLPPRMALMMRKGKCRHMLSGRISYGSCSYGWDCGRCPFDQMIEDTGYLPNYRKPVIEKTSGFDVARNYYYYEGHTWARVEYGGMVRIGVDDFALRLLGPQDRIELPGLGAKVGQGRPAAVLNRSGKEAPTMSPVDGSVVAVNQKISSDARRANDSPYGDGWVMVIQPKELRKNLKKLLFDSEGLEWTDKEAVRLNTLLGADPRYPLMASGGEAARDIYGMADRKSVV